MNDPMMSATYQTPQQQQYATNLPAPMDFPSEFLEPSNTAAAITQTKVNTYCQPTTAFSSNNSSLSSSRTRLVCEDPVISPNVNMANDNDNSLHFLSNALSSAVNDGMESPGQMNFNNDLLDDFEPMTRDRCNTWPMRHPNNDFQTKNSPVIHERIPEEELSYSKNGSQTSINLAQQDQYISNSTQMNSGYQQQQQQIPQSDSHDQELNYDSPQTNYSDGNSPDEDDYQGAVAKRSQTRRNAWGNMSYADLITQAILSSPDQRLTLSQVYEWMVQNVPYFSDKGDSNSSAGWKNSIRHNLSLHSRFMRIQNEGAGKSSWWVLNPEAKAARNPRRRATMDATTKHAIEKKRRGARKRVEMQMQGSIQGSLSSLANRKASQPDFFLSRTNEEPDIDSDYDSFRSRTLSNISAPGNNSQISPTFNPNSEDFNYPQWAPNSSVQQTLESNTTRYTTPGHNINEFIDQTAQICLDNEGEYNQMTPLSTNQQQLGVYSSMPQQVSPNFQIKQEDNKPQYQQASYQELKVVRGVDQQMQNPLLRNQYTQQTQMQQTAPQFQSNQPTSQSYQFGCNRVTNQKSWQTNNNQEQAGRFAQPNTFQQSVLQQKLISPSPISQQNSMGQQQQFGRVVVAPNQLPKDLENLNTFISAESNVNEIDEIIRQELSTTNNLNFDF